MPSASKKSKSGSPSAKSTQPPDPSEPESSESEQKPFAFPPGTVIVRENTVYNPPPPPPQARVHPCFTCPFPACGVERYERIIQLDDNSVPGFRDDPNTPLAEGLVHRNQT